MIFTTDGGVVRCCIALSGRKGRWMFLVPGALPLAMLSCPFGAGMQDEWILHSIGGDVP